MQQVKMTCDRCHKEEIIPTRMESSYRAIELDFGSQHLGRFDLCPECQQKLGIIDDRKKKDKQDPTLAEKLLDVVEEIIDQRI